MNATASVPQYGVPLGNSAVIDIRNEPLPRETKDVRLFLPDSGSDAEYGNVGSRDIGEQSSVRSQGDQKVQWQGLV